jgi:hypothetical protein
MFSPETLLGRRKKVYISRAKKYKWDLNTGTVSILDKLKSCVQMVCYSDAWYIALTWSYFGPVIKWSNHF